MRALFGRVRKLLAETGIEAAGREAQWLIEAGMGRSWADLSARPGTIGTAEEQSILELARRRTGGEPLQYVTGVSGFRHLDLAVGPGVFIPRPETEQVVDRALARLPEEGGIAADIGTGSGAIALALAQERPSAEVWATEISPPALAWAERNASASSSSIHLVRGDLFAGLPPSLRGRVDVVVSNPPYVMAAEADALPDEVKMHEPAVALFACRDGLDVIKRVAAEAREWLREGGWLVLEIGAGQGSQAFALVEGLGYFQVSVRRDLAGRERIVEARR